MAVGPTPITSTHRLSIDVGVPGVRAHKVRLFCNAVVDLADSDGWAFQTPAGSIGMSVAVTNLTTLMFPLWYTSVSFGAIELQKYVTGSWFPAGSDPTTGTGTNGAPVINASSFSVTTRLSDGKKAKLVLLETSINAPVRWTNVASTPNPWKALIQDYLDPTAGHTGSWARTRGAEIIGLGAFISATVSLNKRVRRDRGLV